MKTKKLVNEYGSVYGIEITLESGEEHDRVSLAHCRTRHIIKRKVENPPKVEILYNSVHNDDVWDQVVVLGQPVYLR